MAKSQRPVVMDKLSSSDIRSHGIKSSHITIVGVVFIIHVGYLNFINEAHVVLLYVFVCIFSYNNFNLIAQVLVLS